MNRIGNSLRHWGPNEQLVSALVDAQVEFLIIGGLAVAWYCVDRQADDMDILVNPTIENSQRVFQALSDLPLQRCYSAENFSKPGIQAKFVQHFYAEILTPRNDWPDFDKFYERSVEAKIYDIPIKIPSVRDLIELKKIAIKSDHDAVEKHQSDIESLYKCGM